MNICMLKEMELIAHRGDPRRAPENSRSSWESALAHGARALEVDLRRTKDGTWIVFHDATLRRTTGRSGRVASVKWELLRSLDAGSWFSRRFENEPIPLFSEALGYCRSEGVRVFLDVKVSRYEEELLELLKESAWLSHTSIGAGTIPSLRRWRRFLGGTPLFWVTGFRARLTPRRLHKARRLGVTGIAAYKRWVTKKAVERVHRTGLKLYVWTIRTPAELKRFAAWGVDGLMSEVWPHHLFQGND